MPRRPIPAVLSTPAYPPGSRYADVGTVTWTEPDGSTFSYLERRFCPLPERLATLTTAEVREGDRLDGIAARTLGDPLQAWRIADANAAMDPMDLTDEPGRRLRVPVPQNLSQP